MGEGGVSGKEGTDLDTDMEPLKTLKILSQLIANPFFAHS